MQKELKTICSKCNNPLEVTRIGKQRYCRKCHAAHMRATRPKYSELSPETREKIRIRNFTRYYVKKGKIPKQPCAICKSPFTEAHHENYNKPFEVVWLCKKHHAKIHTK
jgi:hypothetical protein